MIKKERESIVKVLEKVDRATVIILASVAGLGLLTAFLGWRLEIPTSTDALLRCTAVGLSAFEGAAIGSFALPVNPARKEIEW